MTREQAKELLPIIQAFAEGKIVQFKNADDRWYDFNGKKDEIHFNVDPQNYRVKPEPTYRPFKDKEECWNEMLKHQPFGWVRYKDATISAITQLSLSCVSIGKNYYFEEAKEVFTFADGTPFGIKVTKK